MRALYDTARYLTSFNVFEWLVQAAADGATDVVFDIRKIRCDKWPREIALKRFWSICEPAPALAGLNHQVVSSGTAPADAIDFGAPGGARLVAFWKSGRRFKRLRSVKKAGPFKYTVTLRRTQRASGRNSDVAVWLEFAKKIDAAVIADYEDRPIHLHDRVALYAGAKMNFFVSNGPGVLCSLTEYPCMMFCTHHAAGSLEGDGIKGWGAQYPWMLPNQHAVWEEATPESLTRYFDHWKETGRFLT